MDTPTFKIEPTTRQIQLLNDPAITYDQVGLDYDEAGVYYNDLIEGRPPVVRING